jgi:hypothetical protein
LELSRLIGLAGGQLFWAGQPEGPRHAAWYAEHGPRAYRLLEEAKVRANRLALDVAAGRIRTAAGGRGQL